MSVSISVTEKEAAELLFILQEVAIAEDDENSVAVCHSVRDKITAAQIRQRVRSGLAELRRTQTAG